VPFPFSPKKKKRGLIFAYAGEEGGLKRGRGEKESPEAFREEGGDGGKKMQRLLLWRCARGRREKAVATWPFGLRGGYGLTVSTAEKRGEAGQEKGSKHLRQKGSHREIRRQKTVSPPPPNRVLPFLFPMGEKGAWVPKKRPFPLIPPV